jgi:hypothetical protein
MSLRRLSVAQWFGTLGAAAAVAGHFLAGAGLGVANCNPAGASWDLPYRSVQIGLVVAGGLVVLAAEACALYVFRATRGLDDEAPPPEGRMHFFATAAIAANLIFLMIIALNGLASIVDRTCQQA